MKIKKKILWKGDLISEPFFRAFFYDYSKDENIDKSPISPIEPFQSHHTYKFWKENGKAIIERYNPNIFLNLWHYIKMRLK